MKILIGDLLQSKVQTWVNTVNCVGIMGKGIALEFKNSFPEMFADYSGRCERKEVKLGMPYLYKALFPPQIINFPTKDHWKSVSRLADIESGLKYLVEHYKEWGVASLAIPPLGCGNGQLEWKAVGPLIYKHARQMDIPVEIYAPYGTPAQQLTTAFLSQSTTSSSARSNRLPPSTLQSDWLALIEILNRIEKQPYHWPVGRIIFQKIAYVSTRQGLPTGFTYRKGSYGPFCNELKKAESVLINSNLLREERLGRMFVVRVGSNYERIRASAEATLGRWSDIIDKTTDLFMRLNSEQSEIVATVMYVADALKQARQAPPTETEVLASVMEWKQKRRPQLDKLAIASAIRNLAIRKWLDVKPDAKLPMSDNDMALAS